MSTWQAAALTVWGIGTLTALAFFVGKGNLRADYKRYCAEYAAEQQRRQIAQALADAEHSERLWAELERVDGAR